MGVKSTRTITRIDADQRYIDLYLRKKAQARRDKMQPLLEEAGYIGRPYMRGHNLHDLDDEVVVELFHHVDAKIREAEWREKAIRKAASLSDTEMENELESLNDEVAGGEGFENYIITEHPDD